MKTIFTVEVTYNPPGFKKYTVSLKRRKLGVIFEHSGNTLKTVMRAAADAVTNFEETGDVNGVIITD